MLLELLIQDGMQPRRASSTNGGEYSSACPLCGGRDRFRTWPEKERWWCRRCGNRGDIIQYLREVRGMSFTEAAERVGKKVQRPTSGGSRPLYPFGRDRDPDNPFRREPARTGAGVESHPPALWLSHAEEFVSRSHDALLNYSGMMRWLEDGRGLDEETVRAACLGWNQRDITQGGSRRTYHHRTAGLHRRFNASSNPRKVLAIQWLKFFKIVFNI